MLKDHNAVTPVRLEPAAPPSQVKNTTTEPLCSLFSKLKINYPSMQVNSNAECSKGIEHSAILLTFIRLPFVIKILVLSIFEWPFYTSFTRVIAIQCHLLNEPVHEISNNVVCATSKGSDQPAHKPDQSPCLSLEYYMRVKLLTDDLLEILTAHARLSLHLSKCHIVGNHMSRFINVKKCSFIPDNRLL